MLTTLSSTKAVLMHPKNTLYHYLHTVHCGDFRSDVFVHCFHLFTSTRQSSFNQLSYFGPIQRVALTAVKNSSQLWVGFTQQPLHQPPYQLLWSCLKFHLALSNWLILLSYVIIVHLQTENTHLSAAINHFGRYWQIGR